MSFLIVKTPYYFLHQLLLLTNEIEMQFYRILSNLSIITFFNFKVVKLDINFIFESFLNINFLNINDILSYFKNQISNYKVDYFVFFKSDNNKTLESEILYSGLENSSYARSNKFINSYVSYDYKCGNYLGI